MKHNWPLIAAIVAILAIPFGLAAFQDSTREPDEELGDDLDGFVQQASVSDSIDEFAESDDEEDDEENDETVGKWEREEASATDLSFLDRVVGKAPASLHASIQAGDEQSLAALRERLPDGAILSSGPRTFVLVLPASVDIYGELVQRWGAPERFTEAERLWTDDQTGIQARLLVGADSTELVYRF